MKKSVLIKRNAFVTDEQPDILRAVICGGSYSCQSDVRKSRDHQVFIWVLNPPRYCF